MYSGGHIFRQCGRLCSAACSKAVAEKGFFRRSIEGRGVRCGEKNPVYDPLGLSEAGMLGLFSELALGNI